jgi:hypothetical protein
MASRTIIDASAGGSIIKLMPTEAFTLFKKVTDNENKSKSSSRLPRTGPRSRARRTATPLGEHRTQTMPNTCVRHCRGRLEYCRCRLKLTPRTPAEPAKKTLQEHPCSCKASGARPAGPLAWPRGIAPATRGKKVPSAGVSICGILTDTPTDARGLLLGTAIRVP